jgi:hypothetical protein
MAGFFGQGVVAPLSLKEQGTDAMEAPTSASLGASFDLSLSENASAMLARAVTRSIPDEGVLEYWKGYQDPAGRNANSGAMADAEEGAGPAPSPKVLDPEALNERFKLPGLKYDAPMAEKTAQDIYETHRTRLMREDVVKRAGGGVALGAAQLGAGFLAGLLDPLNVAAAFIPIVPEAMVAARLSTAAARASLMQRTAIRAGVGAIEGAGGQAFMEPGMIALNAAELNDYGAAQVLQNLAFGATLGGIIRAGAGHLLDPRLPPEDIRAVAQAALAQVVDGRPVDVTALIDHVNARAAAQRLQGWHTRLGQILDEEEARARPIRDAEGRIQDSIANRGVAIARAEDRLSALRSEADSLRQDHEEVSLRAKGEALDPSSQARLAEVQDELGRVIPKARRAELEREQNLLLEGSRPVPQDGLELSRTQAQTTGLSVALTRTEGEAAKVDASLSKMRAADTAASAKEEARRAKLTLAEKIRKTRADSREEVVTRLMEKEIRRFAYQTGVELPQAEVSRIARELASYSKEDFKAAVGLELNAIAKQSPLDEYRAPPKEGRVPPNTSALRSQADEAAEAVGRQATTPYVDKEIAQAQEANRKLLDDAVASSGTVEGAIKEVQTLHDEAKAAYDIEVKAGRLDDEAVKAELKQIADDEAVARGEAEAVSCVARGLN